MSEYSAEQQAQIIKKWWRQYGLTVMVSVTIAVALVLAWQYYQRIVVHRHRQSALRYQQMIFSISKGHDNQAKAQAKELIAYNKKTPYAQLAMLWLAKDAVEHHQLSLAILQLAMLMQQSTNRSLHDIAGIRLASLYLEQGKKTKALRLLAPLLSGPYASMAYELTGDTYLALGNGFRAKAAYRQSLKSLPSNNAIYFSIQRKLANLPINHRTKI